MEPCDGGQSCGTTRVLASRRSLEPIDARLRSRGGPADTAHRTVNRMLNTALLIYPAPLAFWASFGLTRRLTHKATTVAAPNEPPTVTTPQTRSLLGVQYND